MTNLIKCIVPVFALALVFSAPAYSHDVDECSDSPTTIVLPDCTEIKITTCYCQAHLDQDNLLIELTDLNSTAAPGTNDCALDGDLAATCVITGVQRRNARPSNSTPSPKANAEISCDNCPSDAAPGGTADVTVDATSQNKKNNHYDILLSDCGITKVGFNVHRQTCD